MAASSGQAILDLMLDQVPTAAAVARDDLMFLRTGLVSGGRVEGGEVARKLLARQRGPAACLSVLRVCEADEARGLRMLCGSDARPTPEERARLLRGMACPPEADVFTTLRDEFLFTAGEEWVALVSSWCRLSDGAWDIGPGHRVLQDLAAQEEGRPARLRTVAADRRLKGIGVV